MPDNNNDTFALFGDDYSEKATENEPKASGKYDDVDDMTDILNEHSQDSVPLPPEKDTQSISPEGDTQTISQAENEINSSAVDNGALNKNVNSRPSGRLVRCPYCGNSFYTNNVKYLIDNEHFQDDPDYHVESRTRARTDRKGFNEYWGKYGVNFTGKNAGYVFGLTEKEKSQIPNSGCDPNGNPGEKYIDDSRYIDLDPVTHKVTRIGSRRSMNNYSLNISYCCPTCENYLPDEFFTLPMYKFLIVGTSSVGKTVYMISNLADNCSKITGTDSDGVLTIDEKPLYETRVCNLQYLKAQFARGWLPEGSKNIIPPVFLKFNWNFPDGRKFSHLVWLEDIPGEAANRNAQQILTETVGSMDGVIYLVAPEQRQSEIAAIAAQNCTGIDNVAGYFERMLSGDNMFVRQAETGDPNDPNAAYDSITHLAPDDVIGKANIAFVMTKLGEFLDSNYFHNNGAKQSIDTKNIKFWNILTSTAYAKTNPFDNRFTPYKQKAAYQIFREFFHNLPGINQGPFLKNGYFAVSAFEGDAEMCEDTDAADQNGNGVEKRPRVDTRQFSKNLNIGEPLQWLVIEELKKNKVI